jgi:hypothetical protein
MRVDEERPNAAADSGLERREVLIGAAALSAPANGTGNIAPLVGRPRSNH